MIKKDKKNKVKDSEGIKILKNQHQKKEDDKKQQQEQQQQ